MALRGWGLALSLMLSGCAAGYSDLETLKADSTWSVRHFTSPATPSVAAYHAAPQASQLWVYIEGDGRAWITPRQISDDPTPENAVALHMARTPQDAAVLYVGRPCQYLKKLNAECDSRLWSTERYSADVVAHINSVIDTYRAVAPAQRLVLVGYSGGGVLAALLAGQRQDVDSLVTIAANLDVAAWVRHHKITPLMGSLDPAVNAGAISHVRQVHMVGLKDEIVPSEITQSFVRRMPESANVSLIEEPQFTHNCCWAAEWPRLRAAAAATLTKGH